MWTRRLERFLQVRGSLLAKTALVSICAIQFSLHATRADAATHSVAAGESTINCAQYGGGVQPGDTIVLAGRTRGSLTLNGCRGTSSAPILVRNDTSQSGPLVVEMKGGGFQFQCMDCDNVVIDGTGKWAGAPSGSCGATVDGGEWSLGMQQCGIVLRCVSGGPTGALRLGGSSKRVTIKGVEVDGNVPSCSTRIGISVNDHDYAAKAGEWREGIRLMNNYVHDVEGEGMYVGPNQNATASTDLQLRDNEIGYNVVDQVGCDGINYKSATAGSSSIHHNYVTNTGMAPRGKDTGCAGTGIALFEAGYTDIYSNYVEAPSPVSSGAGNCIAQVISNLSSGKTNTVPLRIFNNVVRNCKGNGISSTRSDGAVATPVVSIFNNTVVAPVGGKGISVGAKVSSCVVRDNIIAGKNVAAASCSVSNNSTEPVESQRFRDVAARDFRLTADSPAVDVATGDCPKVDQAGTSRPQQGACDQGAFEYSKNQAAVAAKPNPPAQLAVE